MKGADKEIGTDRGNLQRRVGINGGYEKLREATIKCAMTDPIKSPVPGFEELVRGHFRIKRDYIRTVCFQWLEEAMMSATEGHYSRLKKNVEGLERTVTQRRQILRSSAAQVQLFQRHFC